MGKWKRNRSKKRRWQRNHLINRDGNVCKICDEPFLKMEDITIDHKIPVSKNGLDELDNYQLAHSWCNQTKDDMTPEEFDEFQKGGKLVE